MSSSFSLSVSAGDFFFSGACLSLEKKETKGFFRSFFFARGVSETRSRCSIDRRRRKSEWQGEEGASEAVSSWSKVSSAKFAASSSPTSRLSQSLKNISKLFLLILRGTAKLASQITQNVPYFEMPFGVKCGPVLVA